MKQFKTSRINNSNAFTKIVSGNNSAGSERKLNLDFDNTPNQSHKKTTDSFLRTVPLLKAFTKIKRSTKRNNDEFLNLDGPKYVKDGDGPIEVYVRIIFSRMGTINTLLERFDCHAFVECYWDDQRLYNLIIEEAKLTGFSGIQLRNRLISFLNTFNFDPYEYWTPKIYFDNAIGEVKEEKS